WAGGRIDRAELCKKTAGTTSRVKLIRKKFPGCRIILRRNGQREYEENSYSLGNRDGGEHTFGAASTGDRFLDQRRGPALLSWRRLLARRILLGLGSRTF